MWQLIENKQKFISQIMTSKSPVRSCEDVDEAALSYAEVKALATGNPAVKEKMALDVEVAKLKLLKANFVSNKYRLEDDIARNFPRQIAKMTEGIKAYKADIAHYEVNRFPDPEHFVMEVAGKTFTDKKEAGAAILAACKHVKASDASLSMGNYQGFSMKIQYESIANEFVLSLKHESVYRVGLGADALGNITRINNALEGIPQKLANEEQRLETVQEQLKNAKEEVKKPFPKEAELDEMLERLSELNALLNMDEKEEPEKEESEKEEPQSIYVRLNAIKQNGEARAGDTTVKRETEPCL
jgi:hypothetical protein